MEKRERMHTQLGDLTRMAGINEQQTKCGRNEKPVTESGTLTSAAIMIISKIIIVDLLAALLLRHALLLCLTHLRCGQLLHLLHVDLVAHRIVLFLLLAVLLVDPSLVLGFIQQKYRYSGY